ncbi:ABC transporter ATP-binding protein [Kineosporia babensis]|uniref:ABC transporter ATP-binding protein n=1 Tax=Kineosporia babensis TaxID=499548 RepID=A0A9X1SXR4_9ACTN|nr:ABC transporter ATP-binding protein [Kineosporia babensis]MCD5316497.1 ABC transporter ATP-binding protein [Kineosporia babensis]
MRSVSAAETAPTQYAWPVEAEDLKVRAGRTMAVDGLDLRLSTGVHGLLGPNGAGKTTLIRALATVLPPAGGQLQLLGRGTAKGSDLREIRRELGYLPQHFGFYPRFTVREFIEYMAWLKEMPDRQVTAAGQRAIDRVALSSHADKKLKALSGGMLRRVGIAQAIVHDPRLVLLDEPTVGLDPAQRVGFRDLLREIGGDTCVLVSTHLVEDVSAACSNVIVMASGRQVWQGTPAQLSALGGPDDPGDSPTERGYSAALGQAGGWG